MKFSSCTIAALFAAPVVGFTVTMSSVAYLDRISTGGGLTSFAPSTPANYSPASYSAPAPAPAPYKSPFADLPPSNDINYMQNLAGGNAMKPGKNYSGVSRKFTASSELPYAAATPSTQAAPAPAPYVSSFAPAPAPATNNLNYMGSLSGGNAMKSGKNYSGVSGSKWGPVKSTGFEPSAPAPAPYVSSFAASAPASGAATPLNYMSSLGGGSAMKSGKNYSGVSNKFGPTKSSTYLDVVSSVAPVASSPVSGASTGPANYMSSLGGGSAMKSGKNYSGVSNKFGPTKSNSYLDTVASVAAPVVSSSSVGVSSGPANYMSSLGGGSAMKSGKNYSGVSNKFGPTKSNSYLDTVASVAAPVESSSSAGVASGPANYMSSLGGGSAMKSGKNYSGVSNKFGPTKSNSYLDQVASATSVSSSSSAPAAGVVSSPLNYMGSLGGGSAMKSGKNYAGVSRSFGPTKSNSYLDQVAQAAPVTSSYTPAATSAAPVVNSLNYMGSLGGGNAMKSGKNYSGVSNKFGVVRSTNSYLDQVKNTVMQPSTYTPAAPAAATSYTYTPPAPAPAAAAVPALNYMSSLSGSTNVATTVKKNYSGFGSTFASAKSGNSYLESVKNGAVQMAPPSYSTQTPAQPASSMGNYLENLAAGGSAVSSSYNSMQNSFAAATGQASYQQQQQPAKPAPASTSSYLSSL